MYFPIRILFNDTRYPSPLPAFEHCQRYHEANTFVSFSQSQGRYREPVTSVPKHTGIERLAHQLTHQRVPSQQKRRTNKFVPKVFKLHPPCELLLQLIHSRTWPVLHIYNSTLPPYFITRTVHIGVHTSIL